MVVELQDALLHEGKESAESLESMMAEMLGNVEENDGYVRPDLDEYTIRKMLLARNYIQKDIGKLKDMKAKVTADWAKRIKTKGEEINNIENIVSQFVQDQNKGQKLQLDIATAYLKKSKESIKVSDPVKVLDYFSSIDKLDQVTETKLNDEKAVEYIEKIIEDSITKLVDNQIEIEKSQNNGKLTKKRQKEIYNEIKEKELIRFKEIIPGGFELTLPKESVSIRSNI